MIELNVKQIRRLKRMTQKELCKKVGISQSYLSQIENSIYTNKRPTLNLIEDISQALEVCPIALISSYCEKCGIIKEENKTKCKEHLRQELQGKIEFLK